MKPVSLRGPFAGLNRQADPSGMRDGQFFALINARLSPNGVVVVCRGGQEKVNTVAAVSGCPELIFDAGDIGSVDAAVGP